MTLTAKTSEIGSNAEGIAAEYLKKQGLILIASNYHSRMGEVDLIMQEDETVVFVEVRYRTSKKYGEAVETITYTKQNKIIKTAERFLQEKKWNERYPCRFDVVTIEPSHGEGTSINWLKNAFQVE